MLGTDRDAATVQQGAPAQRTADVDDIAQTFWDVIVVGTGMGGATMGYALARAGWKVLFCEKGHDTAHGLRGDYAELHRDGVGDGEAARLLRGGRYAEPVRDLSGRRPRSFVPFIGCGTGGSSALYGMVLERLQAADFEPAGHFPATAGATLPARWPIDLDTLTPFYDQAERLYGVRKDEATPPWSAPARELAEHFTARGLHPYRLPQSCEYVPGCPGCQSFLCARNCKGDGDRNCLRPALDQHGAVLLDRCEVLRLEAGQTRVEALHCRRHGREFRLRGRVVVLAAGALATPVLLLASASEAWPQGLANASGLVGRNLMRHYIDLYAVFARTRARTDENVKELGCNDFYLCKDGKFGTLQSFGRLPPARMIVDDLQRELRDTVHPALAIGMAPFKPIMRPVLDAVFTRSTLLASVMEDLPFAENRVRIAPASAAGIAVEYRMRASEAARIAQMRKHVAAALAPYRFLLIKQAENNERIAHACGTCRFGNDPRESVLDADNRAHGIDNLYVVDASFFPSSGGTNPALTIAANALRVAARVLGQAPGEPD